MLVEGQNPFRYEPGGNELRNFVGGMGLKYEEWKQAKCCEFAKHARRIDLDGLQVGNPIFTFFCKRQPQIDCKEKLDLP